MMMLYLTVRSNFRNILGSVQAHSSDGAIVAETVFGPRGMIAGEHDRDVAFVLLSRAGRIDSTREKALRITHYRLISRNGERGPAAGDRNVVRIDIEGGW
jgi:hypothetical protein